MYLGLVRPEEIPVVWPHVRFKLQRAIERVGLDRFDEEAVFDGRHLLWAAYDLEGVHAACTTALDVDGICTIVACGGKKMKQFLPLLSHIEFYYRNQGCKAMRIIGRRGWSRVLPDYKFKAIIIERPL